MSGRQNVQRVPEAFAMANADPTSHKRIRLGWLVCGGMVLGGLLVSLAVYVAVGVYDAFYGPCTLSAEDRFGCALRQFVITALSIIPGGVIGFIIAYWAGRGRHAPDS
jgi:hypothetical protein